MQTDLHARHSCLVAPVRRRLLHLPRLALTWIAGMSFCLADLSAAEPASPNRSTSSPPSRENAFTRAGSTNAPATSPDGELPITTIQGRVVCLPEEMHRRHGIPLPSRHEHLWALHGTNGNLYTILPGRYAEAIFLDERIRARELQLRVRMPPKTQALEIQTVRSIRAGVVQDLYYYCDVCAIKSVSPEICACCQGAVELVEKPLSSDRD